MNDAANKLEQKGLPPLVIIGLQKSGQLAEHAQIISRFLKKGTLLSIDDDYRQNYIYNREQPWQQTFGAETHYGQDFIFKTESGRLFIFSLPYPFSSKEPFHSFKNEKSRTENYKALAQACDLIRHFECDLYDNAVVPIALAHRHSSISLVPGGRVLDLMTASGIKSST